MPVGTIRDKRTLGDDGEWVLTPVFLVDGVECSEAEYREVFPLQEGVPMFGGWSRPVKSEAMAVHPDQLDEVRARNKKHGVNIEYDRIGRPILRNPTERRQLMKIEKLFDKHAYS